MASRLSPFGFLAASAVLLVPVLTLAGCASSQGGNAASVEELGLVGNWYFEVRTAPGVAGELLLTADDRVRVICEGDTTPPELPTPVNFGANSVRVALCGIDAEVRRYDDGRVRATLRYGVSRPTTAGETCEVWNITESGRVCVSRGTSTRSERRMETQMIELTPIGGGA